MPEPSVAAPPGESTDETAVVVVGEGPAGYTAAMYAARAGLRPVCVEGFESGGQIARTNRLQNYPGFPDAVGGQELADRIRKQAVNCGARMVFETSCRSTWTAARSGCSPPDRPSGPGH